MSLLYAAALTGCCFPTLSGTSMHTTEYAMLSAPLRPPDYAHIAIFCRGKRRMRCGRGIRAARGAQELIASVRARIRWIGCILLQPTAAMMRATACVGVTRGVDPSLVTRQERRMAGTSGEVPFCRIGLVLIALILLLLLLLLPLRSSRRSCDAAQGPTRRIYPLRRRNTARMSL
jgi:hypothetical protein